MLGDKQLRPFLREFYFKELGINRAVDEIQIRDCQVDLIFLGHNSSGSVFHGVEIKSNKDSLSRLTKQVQEYSKVLKTMDLVVGHKLLEKASLIIPPWWGIVTYTDCDAPNKPRFRRIRSAHYNPKPTILWVIRKFWRPEMIELANGLKIKSAARGSKDKISSRISKQLIANKADNNELWNLLVEKMLARKDWKS